MTHAPDLAGRYDAYGPIHKALRHAESDLLFRLGRADFDDTAAAAPLLADLRTLLAFGRGHLEHEGAHIHRALEARAAASTAWLEDQHEGHRRAFADLAALIAALEAAAPAERPACGRRLYLAFTAFVGHDLVHMHEEETVAQPMLWSLYTDEELRGLERAIVGALTPEQRMVSMRLMIPALNPSERAALLGAMKLGAPPAVFDAVIAFAAKPSLSAEEFSDLAGRIGVAA